MTAFPLCTDGLVAFVKRACPTCAMIESQMREVAAAVPTFRVVSQDDPRFPSGVTGVIDDRELDYSWLNGIEATPTLIRYTAGREVERVVGWDRAGWQRLTGVGTLGARLPPMQPG
ncbi:MAG: thioredoxin family protein [Burkholderiales bacterium]